MSRLIRALGVAFVMSAIGVLPVLAQSLDSGTNMSYVSTTPTALEGLRPLAKTDLSKFAGGTAIDNLSIATNTSTVTGNTIGNIGTTGAIGGNVVSGTSGLTTFIANSGNQVVISQSTVVNVYLH